MHRRLTAVRRFRRPSKNTRTHVRTPSPPFSHRFSVLHTYDSNASSVGDSAADSRSTLAQTCTRLYRGKVYVKVRNFMRTGVVSYVEQLELRYATSDPIKYPIITLRQHSSKIRSLS